jgi:hypothetical protein
VETGKREGTYRPQAVWLYSDGMFHWIYEKDLYKNRFETNYVLRIMILVFVLSWLLMMGCFWGLAPIRRTACRPLASSQPSVWAAGC